MYLYKILTITNFPSDNFIPENSNLTTVVILGNSNCYLKKCIRTLFKKKTLL